MIDGRYIEDGFPGIGRYTYNLIRALGRLGSGDALLVLHRPGARNTRYDVEALGRLPGVRLVATETARWFPAEQWHLPAIVRRLDPDVFHAPFYLKPFLLPCPSVVSVHDLIPLHHPRPGDGPAARLFFRVTTRVACRTSRAILVPSAWTARDLVTRLGLPPERVHLAPSGVDHEHFLPPRVADVEAFRRRRRLPERYVIALGSNEPHKNLGGLLDAWARIEGEERDVTLVVAGRESPHLPDARALVRARALSRPVVVLGDVPEMELPALYAGAACLVHPSLAEGFGLPVLEAMACGTPVVCSSRGALPEVVGDAALVADPTDPAAFADAIRRLLRDTALRQELRARGLARSAHFSWEATARASLGAYRAATQ